MLIIQFCPSIMVISFLMWVAQLHFPVFFVSSAVDSFLKRTPVLSPAIGRLHEPLELKSHKWPEGIRKLLCVPALKYISSSMSSRSPTALETPTRIKHRAHRT